jgi:LmbE family N-acetylglucosaminyl deacetylase
MQLHIESKATVNTPCGSACSKRPQKTMLRILCLTAHPDDEAGAFGGTLLLYHDRGVETHVLCMTAGTAARNRGTARSDEELAALRRAEFAASCRLLKVTRYEVLVYTDGQLNRTDLDRAVEDLTRRMRQLRPHVVLTFGPDGGLTGHRDHAMAGVFATMAFESAGRVDRFPDQIEQGLQAHRGQKLYYVTADYVVPDLPTIAPPTVTARVEVGAERFEMKHQAFRLHKTQSPLFERVRKNLGRRGGAEEMYHLALTREPREAKMETDLLEGVVDE